MTLTGLKDSFHFFEPAFLYLLMPLAVLFVLWLGVVVVKLIKRPKKTFGSKYPLFAGKGRLWFSVILSGTLMVLAMAKPSLSRGSFKASRGDIEVVLVVDRSISMRANDVRPSRLDIAKREAGHIESLLASGDKLALFIFGKESHRKIYLSGKFENTFGRLARVSFPSSLAGDGLIWDSDFTVMLENIYHSMDRQDSGDSDYLKHHYLPQKKTNRIVIIFTDGEDQFKKDKPTTLEEAKFRDDYIKRLNSALAEFRKRGLKIYPVGIGTQKGVSWQSLLRGYKNGTDYYENELNPQGWQNGVSRIDKDNLMFLAHSTGIDLSGNVWTVESSSTTVKNYLSSIINSNRRTLLEFSQSEDDQDLWQYFLLAAIGILALGIFFYPVSGYFSQIRK